MLSSDAIQVSRSALLPYRADQLFDLINDIEAYPDFLDGCNNAEVLAHDGEYLEARLHLNKKGIRQSFSTRNRLFPHERITMELIDGPFKALSGEWKIAALADQGCKLSLDLEFTMGDSLMMKLASPFFGEMGNKLLDAVVAEASKRFG